MKVTPILWCRLRDKDMPSSLVARVGFGPTHHRLSGGRLNQTWLPGNGGAGGNRTPKGVTPLTVFKTAAHANVGCSEVLQAEGVGFEPTKDNALPG